MKKTNIKKNIAAIAIVATLVSGGASIAIESNIDHAHEYCPFCNIIGMNKQKDVINNSHKYDGYTAAYVPAHDEVNKYVTNSTKVVCDNGEIMYVAPAGYDAQGEIAIRFEKSRIAESLEVTDYRNLNDIKTNTISKRK